jgi:hypothetical protein
MARTKNPYSRAESLRNQDRVSVLNNEAPLKSPRQLRSGSRTKAAYPLRFGLERTNRLSPRKRRYEEIDDKAAKDQHTTSKRQNLQVCAVPLFSLDLIVGLLTLPQGHR